MSLSPHKIKCLFGPKHVDANKNTRMPPGCHADAMWMPHGHGKVYHTTELNTCDFCTPTGELGIDKCERQRPGGRYVRATYDITERAMTEAVPLHTAA
jgi:hypothetical protein